MDYQEFELYDDKLPGFNEMMYAAKKRGGFGGYALMKRNWTTKIIEVVQQQKLFPIDKIFLSMVWFEPTKRRDPDNIASFIKFILDGLQKAEIIKNDGWSQVLGWKNSFEIGPKRGVRVRIYETDYKV